MLTKKQKIEKVDKKKDTLKNARSLIFVDFTGAAVSDLKNLRNILRSLGAKFEVIKKRLLRITLKESGYDFNPEQFDSQVGTIFTEKDFADLATPIYKFSKEVEKKGFKILGAYDLSNKKFIEGEIVKSIGKLPPREVLLAQIIGLLASPIKKFMFILSEKSKVEGK